MSWLKYSEPKENRVPFDTDEHPVLSDPEDEDVMDYPLGAGHAPSLVTEEQAWQRFVQHTMANAVRCMESLRSTDCKKLLRGVTPGARGAQERLRNSFATYAWVHMGTGDCFRFDRVCESVGLDPDIVRQKMAAVCPEDGDINEVVSRFLAGKLL